MILKTIGFFNLYNCYMQCQLAEFFENFTIAGKHFIAFYFCSVL